MDHLAKVTLDKFQTNDNVIGIQDHLQQMNSSEDCSVSKHGNHFIQKFLTKDVIGTVETVQLMVIQIVKYLFHI